MMLHVGLLALSGLAGTAGPGVPWNMAVLSKPPATYPAPGFAEPGVQALFYDGPGYAGKPATRVFAWMGIPKARSGRKVPGIVLIHGGGGTAFANWVRMWNERGYAAIAMDTCGCVPKGTYGAWERHADGGPPGWGGFDQMDGPATDHWTYHAVAAAIRGHSLLRAQPGVDASRIGVTGISWGGCLTCIVAGVDPRFRFASPVYGCGFYDETTFAGALKAMKPEHARRWMETWDPSRFLPRASMPMLWVTGTNDFAYTLNALQKSYRLPRGRRTLAIRIRMPHGHGPAGEAPREIWEFADSILMKRAALTRITRQGRDGSQVWAVFSTRRRIVRAELTFTRDGDGPWPDRPWESAPASVQGSRVSATLPSGTRVYYLNLFDDRECVVSSEHEELP